MVIKSTELLFFSVFIEKKIGIDILELSIIIIFFLIFIEKRENPRAFIFAITVFVVRSIFRLS